MVSCLVGATSSLNGFYKFLMSHEFDISRSLMSLKFLQAFRLMTLILLSQNAYRRSPCDVPRVRNCALILLSLGLSSK